MVGLWCAQNIFEWHLYKWFCGDTLYTTVVNNYV